MRDLSANIDRALQRIGVAERATPGGAIERVMVGPRLKLVRDDRDLAELAVAAYRAAQGRAPADSAALLRPEVPRMVNGQMTLNGKTCCYHRCDTELRRVETLRLPFDFKCTCGSQWRISSQVEAK